MLSAAYLGNRRRSTAIVLGIAALMRLRRYRRLPGYLLAGQAIALVAASADLWLHGKKSLEREIEDLTCQAYEGRWGALDPYKRQAIEQQAAQLGYRPIYSRAGDLENDHGIPHDLALFWTLDDRQKAHEFDQYTRHLSTLKEPACREVDPVRWVRHNFEVALFTLVCTGLALRWLQSPRT